MKSFIAFSGGVESSAMCVLYGRKSQPIFTDTGWEHKIMYERLERVEETLKKLHGPEFTILRIKPESIQSTGTSTLPDYITFRKFFPNSQARFCTRLTKIEPLDKFLSNQGECELLIGLNADEVDDREGNYGLCKNVNYRYPLIEAGLSRADCSRILDERGLLPNFPAYMSRGGCKGCFFKRKREYAAMALLAPEEADEIADLEEALQDNRGRYYSIHPDIPNMRDFLSSVRAQGRLLSIEEIYRTTSDGKSCGVFCHR